MKVYSLVMKLGSPYTLSPEDNNFHNSVQLNLNFKLCVGGGLAWVTHS